jgi:hypothetical protein
MGSSFDIDKFRITGDLPLIPRKQRAEKSTKRKKFSLVKIDTETIGRAVEANPNALAVLLLVAGRARGLAIDGWVTVPTAAREEIGLGRTRYGRALTDMEAAGLIEVDRANAVDGKPAGRSAKVRLLVDLGLPQRGSVL